MGARREGGKGAKTRGVEPLPLPRVSSDPRSGTKRPSPAPETVSATERPGRLPGPAPERKLTAEG